MPLVLTACTNRKRAPASPALRAAALERGALADVAADWVGRLADSADRVPARRLYAGRGFQEAIAAAEHIGADLAIVSAGLGLIDADKSVPPYALSAVDGSDSVFARVTDGSDACGWWRAVSAASPFGRPLADVVGASSGVVIVALSEGYLAMVADGLKALSAADAARLRIVTRAPAERVDPALRDRLMPYDDRLDGPDSPVRGTRGDFAARAARHFAREVAARLPGGSAKEHAAAVASALAEWRAPPAFERVRHDDETLLGIIRENWARAGGQSSKLLRVLRDELNIACEQGRFVGLMNRLRQEREAVA